MTSGLFKIILFDIDGTIADTAHRLHHLYPEEGKKKNWSAFFAEAVNDQPHNHVINLVRMYDGMGYLVILCTGRPANLRNDTIEWLSKQDVPYDVLLMRLTTDRGPDTEVKKHLLLSFLSTNGYEVSQIEAAFEDRLHVAEMWRDLGIPVFLCGEEYSNSYLKMEK